MTPEDSLSEERAETLPRLSSMETSSPSQLRLLSAVQRLKAGALELEQHCQAELERVHPRHQLGARNLVHYLAVRQHDLRSLQNELASLGLSSLGRMETCVLPTLSRVEHALGRLLGKVPVDEQAAAATHELGARTLENNTEALLGPSPDVRRTRVMVTLSVDTTQAEIEALLREGMNVARVNCSKGTPKQWLVLCNAVQKAREQQGIPCPILFDLAGPNPRSADASDAEQKTPRVGVGDRFTLAASWKDVRRAQKQFPKMAIVACTMPEIIANLRVGERVLFDDGKIMGTVDATEDGLAHIRVTGCSKAQVKLKAGKGLNFPDSDLGISGLTDKDGQDLDFVAEHADIVGLSFIRGVEDVERLQRELEARGADHLGLLLKVETTRGFNSLGKILLRGMLSERVGVMVARGDMAAELGFVRLAEAQEEVLWLSEAALVPVVWATQVLENLCKTGVPSRAEVTDAAMSGRAECVMLNRGEHTVAAVRFLRDVLERMQAHQNKKRSMLRRLSISELDFASAKPS